MNGLILHCGGQLRSKEEVFAVPIPPATSSYTPLPHESLVTRVEKQLAVEGIVIKEERLALAKEGQRLFGLLHVRIPGSTMTEFGCVIGIRNSYDKSLPSGLCIGATVFVCDNLSFRGSEITYERRHTPNLLRDLSWVITQTIAGLPKQFAAQSSSFEAYRRTEIPDAQAHDLVIKCYDQGAVNVTDIPALLKEWREPRHPEFSKDGKTVWRLFNAATETIKRDLWRLPMRTGIIQDILDREFGFTPAAVEKN